MRRPQYLLRQWILTGAAWDQHWSFGSIEAPAVPAVTADGWPRQSLDRFILSMLEAEGLSPAPASDRATLARRVTLDLTGLPPDPGTQIAGDLLPEPSLDQLGDDER